MNFVFFHCFPLNFVKKLIPLNQIVIIFVGKKDEPFVKKEGGVTVDVDVTTPDGRAYIVDIKSNGQGGHKNHTDFEKKIIFCKAVSYFYKNWARKDLQR